MNSPLADRLRPKKIEDVAGQRQLLAEGKILRRLIDSGNIPNLIFYGPSGVGKTTVANIIAENCGKKLYYLNATTASTADIKDILSRNDKVRFTSSTRFHNFNRGLYSILRGWKTNQSRNRS